jgi:hypothetical protein
MTRTVLQNITDDTELVKVAATSFSTKRFFERNLNIADRILVPCSTEGYVGKPKNEEVLHHLFTEIVIDTEGLLLGPVLFDRVEELSGRFKVLAKRLLDDDTIDTARLVVAVLLEVLGDGDEDTGRESQVEDPVGFLRLIMRLNLLQVSVEFVERFAFLVAARDVCGHLSKGLDGGGDLGIIVGVLQVRGLALVELSWVHFGAGISDDFDVPREEALTIEPE